MLNLLLSYALVCAPVTTAPSTLHVVKERLEASKVICLDPYKPREAPGPIHGDSVYGDDPHDEIHDRSLPAYKDPLPAKREQDKYYKDGLHAPDALINECTKSENEESDPKDAEDRDVENKIPQRKSHAKNNDKKRVSDLNPIPASPL